MGFTRKLLSTCSGGIVDFRSDKERTARSARLAHHEARRIRRASKRGQTARQAGAQGWPTTEVGRAAEAHLVWQDEQRRAAALVSPAQVWPPLPPADWYPDPGRPGSLRWWDGRQWTGYTRPM